MADKPGIYAVWNGMKQRCYNPQSASYSRYGARGIRVCTEWHSFKNFEADMLPTYKMGLFLDRVDVDGDYEPANCRWLTRKGQQNNMRSNRLVTIGGKTKTLSEWIDDSPVKSSTVRQRFYVYKWDAKRALEV